MEEIKKVRGKYQERSSAMVVSLEGTNGNGIPTNDPDGIIVTVTEKGHYMILAKGSYEGRAYCIVDIVLFVYSVKNNRMLGKQVISTNYNFQGLVSKDVKLILSEPLERGDQIELRYGNINHSDGASDAQQSFSYAAPGDFLALIKYQR